MLSKEALSVIKNVFDNPNVQFSAPMAGYVLEVREWVAKELKALGVTAAPPAAAARPRRR